MLLVLTAGMIQATGVLENGQDGLVAEYRFDTGAGNTAYDTAGNNDGTINGATWTSGVKGKALKFGGDDNVALSSSSSLPSGSEAFTISTWVKIPSSCSSRGGIFGYGNWGSSDQTNALRTTNSCSGVYHYFWGNDQGTGNIGINDGRWHHVAVTYNGGSSRKIFVDGRLEASDNPGSVNMQVQDVNIGVTNNNEYFNGKIDGLKVYSTNLSKSQIRSLYNSGSWRIGTVTSKEDPSKVAEFSFQHQNSSHVLDTSGYNNHGLIEGSASQVSAVGCQVGRCYQFDNGDDKLDNVGVDINQNWTVMTWFKYPNGGLEESSHWRTLTRGDGGDHQIIVDKGSYRLGTYDNTGNQNFIGCGYDINSVSNGWHHLAVSQKYGTSGNMTFYINGRQVCDIDGYGSTTDIRSVGNHFGNGQEFGTIDQFKIFNRSLSQAEIIEKTQKLQGGGTVLDLRFNRDGGDKVHDYSGESSHGTLQPNASAGPKWVDGVTGNALRFDGNDDFVKLPNKDGLNPKREITISFWSFNPAGETGSDFWNGGGWSVNGTTVWHINPNEMRVELQNTATGEKTTFDTSVPTGEWFHFTVTWSMEDDTIRTYVDGELRQTAQFTGPIGVHQNPPVIGYNNDRNGWYFDGKIDLFKIYPYDISKSKVEQLYSRGRSRVGSSNTGSNVNLQKGLVLSQAFNRVETCGQSDTVSCPSGMNGEVAVDESGEANHGELVNGPSVKSAGKCVIGGCLGFDGSSSFVEVADSSSTNTGSGDLTVSSWVKVPESYNPSDFRVITGDHGGGNPWSLNTKGYVLGISDAGVPILKAGNGTDKISGTASNSVIDGEWHKLTGVYNESAVSMYVDGEHVSTQDTTYNGADSLTGSVTTSNPTGIGSSGTSQHRYIKASIDQVRVYNRSLSKQEVWKLYTVGRRNSPGEMAGPVSHWRMDKLPDFGDGDDGSVTVSSDTNINEEAIASGRTYPDGVVYNISGIGDSYVESKSVPAGISGGDEVLVINLQGTWGSHGNVGEYAFKDVSSVSGSRINFETPLSENLGDPSNQRIAVQRVPNYQDVTIDGGTLTANQWNATLGGIVAFRAKGKLSFINGGSISVSGKGFRGGTCGNCGDDWDGGRGEGIVGWDKNGGTKWYDDSVSLNNLNGGGGNHVNGNDGGDPGAGGGYGTSGESVPDAQSEYASSEGGESIGDRKLSKIFFGGGGGAGADADGDTSPYPGKNDGGGIAFVSARNISNAEVYSKGDAATCAGGGGSASGGAGAGGTVWLKSLDLDISTVNASGGAGTGDCSGDHAGYGGDGRVRLDYATLSGSSDPAAYKSKIGVEDVSGKGDAAKIKGDPHFSDGKRREAISLDGSSDRLRTGLTRSLQDKSFSVTLWMKADSRPTSGKRLVYKDSGGGGWSLSYGDPGAGRLRFYIRPLDTTSLDTGDVIQSGKWYHVTAVRDSEKNNRYIYVNGERKASITSDTGTTPKSNDRLMIGAENSGSKAFNGKIDDVRVYPYALTSEQVKKVMHNGGVGVRG